MKKALTLLLAIGFSVANVFAATADLVVNDDGKIQIDDQNPRVITGCWDSDNQAVMFYRKADRTIYASEICNEPDEEHHGLGLTVKARALNYYDFLNQTKAEIANVQAPIVLGSLSGYNYQWLKEFLKLDGACSKFDVLAFHPYHLGVAPDEINTDKNAWHTVEQWVNFYHEILKNAGCDKPIWATEFGFSTTDFDAEKAVSVSQQSDFALKEAVMLLGTGVKRVSYFDKNTFELDSAGTEAWNDLAAKLVGAKFEKLTFSGDNYCPRETSCFYDESEYRTDTGKSVFGLPADPTAIAKNRTYSFVKDDDSRVFVYWTTGKAGIGVVDSPFSDISPASSHLEAILDLTKRGLISGYDDGTFGADKQINRAEFLKILVGATKDAGLTISGKNCFPDVGDLWFSPYVCYAKAHGWVNGYADGTFRPANPINRAEALKILANAFGWSMTSASGAWYEPFANAAIAKNVLLSSEAKDYDKYENRGFVAELVWRALQ
ncbi:MAG: S-layer homology domain-containing protein [Patescibacteria group bacterium]